MCHRRRSEPAPTVTVTATEEVAAIPAVCQEALDLAADSNAQVKEFGELVQRLLGEIWPAAINSAYNRDTVGIEATVSQMEDFNSDLGNLAGGR